MQQINVFAEAVGKVEIAQYRRSILAARAANIDQKAFKAILKELS